MIEAELDEARATAVAEEPDDHATVAPDLAPQCAGCHRRGIELTLLENGKRYCVRCAQEVERLMGIGPLFPTDGESGYPTDDDHEHAADDEVADAVAAREPSEVIERAPPTVVTPPPAVVAAVPIETAPIELVAEQESAATLEPLRPLTLPTPREMIAQAPPVATTSDDAADVAASNREAANSSHPLIPRPPTISPSAPEEPPVMERVQEQTRPARVETAAPPSQSGLAGALAAERARLRDQRELIEARFRAEVQAIDERLVHVESLLGDERTALAS